MSEAAGVRFAIYYAPEAETPLSRLATQWLGRDADANVAVPRPPIPGLAGCDLDRLTAGPGHYGFHATLKAPFRLDARQSARALFEAVDGFARSHAAFAAPLAVRALGQFIALRPAGDATDINALARAAVMTFEPFRAPLSPADIERRRKAKLTARQDAQMLRWGYPYIFEDFRFHMTLTGRIVNDETRARAESALAELFAGVLAEPHVFSGLSVFRQDGADAPFLRAGFFPFGGEAG